MSFDLLGSDEMSRDIEAQRRANAEKLEAERRAAQELEIAKQVQARLVSTNLSAADERWTTQAPASRRGMSAATTTISFPSGRSGWDCWSATFPAKELPQRC